MSALFDIDAIRGANPPEKVFSLLGIAYVRKGSKLKSDCPGCNKENKFDYNVDKDVFNCFSCGFGADCRGVIDLVMAVLGRDFVGACQYLGGAKTLTPSEKRAAEIKRKEYAAEAKKREVNKLRRTRKKMEDILAGCQPGGGTLAEDYLRGRGHSLALSALGWPSDILFHPGLEAYVGEGKDAKCVGVFPAMISKGREAGKLVLLHRTFLAPRADGRMGKAAPAMPSGFGDDDWNAKQMLGVLSRCRDGVYLGASPGVTNDPNAPIFVAEGIESGLALASAGVSGIFYAALSLNRLTGRIDASGAHVAGWLPPHQDGYSGELRNDRPVIVACDNDLSPTKPFPDYVMARGKKVSPVRAQAAFARAQGRLIAAGHRTGLWFPPLGCDPEDALFEIPEDRANAPADKAPAPQHSKESEDA